MSTFAQKWQFTLFSLLLIAPDHIVILPKQSIPGRLFRAADALYYAELVENVKDEVQAMSVLMRALAFKHLAQTRSLEGEIGAAVGYAHEASRLVHALKVPPAYAKWLEGVDAHVVAHIDRVYADLHAENANVYFAIVTPASEMDGPQVRRAMFLRFSRFSV